MTIYLIDGYNLLHALLRAEGREAGEQVQEGALEDERRRLLDRIASYMGGTSDRAIVVFDSHTAKLQRTQGESRNVTVYFASFQRSADAIIEREIYALSRSAEESAARAGKGAPDLVVVTSDYGLQKTVFLPNVTRRSSRQFVQDLQEHTRTVANRADCITMGHRVEDRLDPASLDRLKALRDRLSEHPGEDEKS